MVDTKRPIHTARMQLREARRANPAATAGAILIAVGLIAALTATKLGSTILLLLVGVALVGWGIVHATYRPIAFGTTMIGLGVGALLIQVNVFSGLTVRTGTGVVLLSVGIAMLLTPLLELAFTPQRRFWILVPGVISTVVGVAFIVGGGFLDFVQRLRWIGNLWPVIPIAIGLYLLLVVARRALEQPPTEA